METKKCLDYAAPNLWEYTIRIRKEILTGSGDGNEFNGGEEIVTP